MIKKITIICFLVIVLSATAFSEEERWSQLNSTHFIVYYKDVPRDFIDEVINSAEDYYQDITRELGFTRYKYWLWEERAKIYIYNDEDEYRQASGKPAWASGHADYKSKTIYTYPLAWGFFDTLLPHELGHIIFREFVGYQNKAIPLWLDEGVATSQEKARRWGADKLVKKAIDEDRFMPLDKLTEIRSLNGLESDKINLFYSESASIVYYLISNYGRYSFMDLCRSLREGKSLDEAIDAAYSRFNDLEELNYVWVRYLESK